MASYYEKTLKDACPLSAAFKKEIQEIPVTGCESMGELRVGLSTYSLL
jgi:hypothetical protein